jgi:hypothetical protein
MQGKKREQWQTLCQMAADEKDPDRLLALVQQITKLLDEKQQRLQALRRN